MGKILILQPETPSTITATAGTGAANLNTPDPLEVFRDPGVASSFAIEIDYGAPRTINTVFLGGINGSVAAAQWSLQGGLAAQNEFTIATGRNLRVPEVAGLTSQITHAFWTGAAVTARYLRITFARPTGAVMTIAELAAGNGFTPKFNNEWGAARGVKDTGTITRLADGGLSIVEGVRYDTYSWTLGDLTDDEADFLYRLMLKRGESRTVLVCEDPDNKAGLRERLHFGLLTNLRPYDRRGVATTRWDMTIEGLIPLER